MIKLDVGYNDVKRFWEQNQISPKVVKIGSNYHVLAIIDNLALECIVEIKYPKSAEQIDIDANVLQIANKVNTVDVATSLEKNDKDLKAATLRAVTDSETGIAVVEFVAPGTPGAENEGRYIMGAEAFFKEAHAEDRVTKIEVVDVYDLLGYGAGTVIKSYHDDEMPEENQGWYIGVDQYNGLIGPHASYIDVKPLGGYAFLPAGFAMRITAVKDPSSKSSVFYVNLLQGRYSP